MATSKQRRNARKKLADGKAVYFRDVLSTSENNVRKCTELAWDHLKKKTYTERKKTHLRYIRLTNEEREEFLKETKSVKVSQKTEETPKVERDAQKTIMDALQKRIITRVDNDVVINEGKDDEIRKNHKEAPTDEEFMSALDKAIEACPTGNC